MYKIYNSIIEVIDINQTDIHLFIKNNGLSFKWKLDELEPNKSLHLFDYEIRDQLLMEYTSDKGYFYIFSYESKIYLLLEEDPTQVNEIKWEFNIENFHNDIYVKQYGLAKFEILNNQHQQVAIVDSFLNSDPVDYNVELKLEVNSEDRFILLSKASYGIYHLVVSYDCMTESVNIYKVLFDSITTHPNITVNIENKNEILIYNKNTKQTVPINFQKLNIYKPRMVFEKESLKDFPNENILAIYVINKARYFIYLKSFGVFIARSNPLKVTQHRAKLRIFGTRSHFYIYGRFTHHAFNSFQKYDYLYLRNSDHKVTKFYRPFASIKFLKRYGYFKIPYSSLEIDDRIHNNFFVGNSERIIHNLHFRRPDKKVKTYIFRKNKDKLNVVRTNLRGNITLTVLPFSQEYTLKDRIKIKAAKLISKWAKDRKRNLNLFFEKKSNKADESAFRVYEKVMAEKGIESHNYFILNEESEHYPYMKSKYGKNIIDKYSFRHYLSIFNADYFISSEISNHVLSDRLYIDELRNKIMSVPLVFLQHGIMFAKPVDNPMAYGFHKDKTAYNVYKSVISSHLEAGEFRKMNYEDDDLILTGLATFDYAKMDKTADKIAFMPTYRYWEEGLIYNNEIEETSYYKTILKVIKEFEKEGLADRLLIVPHNKFSEFIYRNMPEYKHMISDNPSEALKQAKIFITDYSSAIYDAQYRGAYPIFYWEEKDYLIRQYKAIPPVNEENAPGPVVYSVGGLLSQVKKAIENNYEVEEEYRYKYSLINHFNDNKNTDRIIDFLKSDKII